MNNNTNKKMSLPIGLILIVIWGLVLISIMFNTIKKYSHDDLYDNMICIGENC